MQGFIIVTQSESNEGNFTYQVFKIVANLLEIIDASANVFIYSLCNGDIRRRYSELCKMAVEQV